MAVGENTGKRYSQSEKDLAYQLWAFVCGRNAEKVSAAMKTGDWGAAIDITSRTVRDWAVNGRWEERQREDMQRIAPDLRGGILTELLLAGKEAAEYARGVVRGTEVPEKTRATVSLAVLGMLGFTQQPKDSSQAMQALASPKVSDALPDLAKLSPEELNALEARYKTRQ